MATALTSGTTGGLLHWLDAMPHPHTVCEIAQGHVALASASGSRLSPESFAAEPIPAGAVVPSPVEPNVTDADSIRSAVSRLRNRIAVRGQSIALLVPDQAVRVFLLHFETFPRDHDDAVPLLRWRLKKSVPFDVEETVVSYVAQPPRIDPASGISDGVDILAAIARQRIIRQYEELLEAEGFAPGVVLSSTLAVLPLLDGERPTLLARLAGTTLTTAIVRGESLCVYRCTEMSADASRLEPQALLDEVYPAAAYFQDSWRENVGQVRLAGFGARADEFRRALESGLGCSVSPLAASAFISGAMAGDSKAMMDRQFDALIGWMMNRGA
jgi:type IV pilus assembly protein PilM